MAVNWDSLTALLLTINASLQSIVSFTWFNQMQETEYGVYYVGDYRFKVTSALNSTRKSKN